MNKLLLILVLAGGYFGYQEFYKSSDELSKTDSINGKMLRGIPVTANEILTVANKIVNQLCNDELYQVSGGSTVQKCNETLSTYQSLCEYKYFPAKDKTYLDTEVVSELIQKYTSCSNNEIINT